MATTYYCYFCTMQSNRMAEVRDHVQVCSRNPVVNERDALRYELSDFQEFKNLMKKWYYGNTKES